MTASTDFRSKAFALVSPDFASCSSEIRLSTKYQLSPRADGSWGRLFMTVPYAGSKYVDRSASSVAANRTEVRYRCSYALTPASTPACVSNSGAERVSETYERR